MNGFFGFAADMSSPYRDAWPGPASMIDSDHAGGALVARLIHCLHRSRDQEGAPPPPEPR